MEPFLYQTRVNVEIFSSTMFHNEVLTARNFTAYVVYVLFPLVSFRRGFTTEKRTSSERRSLIADKTQHQYFRVSPNPARSPDRHHTSHTRTYSNNFRSTFQSWHHCFADRTSGETQKRSRSEGRTERELRSARLRADVRSNQAAVCVCVCTFVPSFRAFREGVRVPLILQLGGLSCRLGPQPFPSAAELLRCCYLVSTRAKPASFGHCRKRRKGEKTRVVYAKVWQQGRSTAAGRGRQLCGMILEITRTQQDVGSTAVETPAAPRCCFVAANHVYAHVAHSFGRTSIPCSRVVDLLIVCDATIVQSSESNVVSSPSISLPLE